MQLTRKSGRCKAATAIFAAAILLSAVSESEELPQLDRVLLLPEPRDIGNATLIDQDGNEFELVSLRGKPALVFFGFANCRDVCPLAMAKYREVELSELLEAEDLSFVLISVDGERDTPAVLKQYLSQYSDRYIGLTGDPEFIQTVARRFRAPFYKGNASTPDRENYSVAHSTQIFLLDSLGRLRAELHNPAAKDIAALIHAMPGKSRK